MVKQVVGARFLARAIGIVSLVALGACSDEGEGDGGGGASAGGSPATGASGGGGASGGAGGGGASAGGGGAGGGSGGGLVTAGCIDAAPHAATLEILDDDLCLLAVVDGPELDSLNAPSWGSHGGPLQAIPGVDTVVVTRWSVVNNATLTAATASATTTGVPVDAFWGGLAVETAATSDTCGDHRLIHLGWTGADFVNQGQLVTVGDGAAASQAQATGLYGMAGVGSRLFYTGISAVGGPNANDLALYSADGDPCTQAIGASQKLAAGWGLAAGPVAADVDGNVFAVMTDYLVGTQELRGFKALDAGGAGPITPVQGATFDGFGDGLAAVPPTPALPGLVVLQPNDGASFAYLDLVGQEYTSAGGSLELGATRDVVHFGADDTNVSLFTDDQGRLWIGVPYHEKNAPFQSTRFYVLGRG